MIVLGATRHFFPPSITSNGRQSVTLQIEDLIGPGNLYVPVTPEIIWHDFTELFGTGLDRQVIRGGRCHMIGIVAV